MTMPPNFLLERMAAGAADLQDRERLTAAIAHRHRYAETGRIRDW